MKIRDPIISAGGATLGLGILKLVCGVIHIAYPEALSVGEGFKSFCRYAEAWPMVIVVAIICEAMAHTYREKIKLPWE